LLHQVGDLFELNAKLRCQKVKGGVKEGLFTQASHNSINVSCPRCS